MHIAILGAGSWGSALALVLSENKKISLTILHHNDYYDNHIVRSDIMLQIVLKSYGYYDGKVDGNFGSVSKKALVLFQGANNLSPDGVLGQKTCNLLLNKKNIVANNQKNEEIVNVENSYSQETYDALLILIM